MMLRRYARDGGLPASLLPPVEPKEEQALFSQTGPLALGDKISGYKIVLEEYAFAHAGELPGAAVQAQRSTSTVSGDQPSGGRGLGEHFKAILGQDPVWREVASRLVVISDGILSFFTHTACDMAQHVAIDYATGAPSKEGFFSQENVPSETMFYACLNIFEDRTRNRPKDQSRGAEQVFAGKLEAQRHVFQFGGDASTGLGLCTLQLKDALTLPMEARV